MPRVRIRGPHTSRFSAPRPVEGLQRAGGDDRRDAGERDEREAPRDRAERALVAECRYRDHEEREDATAPDGHRDDVYEVEGDVSRIAARGRVRDERCPKARGEPSECDELPSQIARHKALRQQERTHGDGAGGATQ
jgi:hypothetical protein